MTRVPILSTTISIKIDILEGSVDSSKRVEEIRQGIKRGSKHSPGKGVTRMEEKEDHPGENLQVREGKGSFNLTG